MRYIRFTYSNSCSSVFLEKVSCLWSLNVCCLDCLAVCDVTFLLFSFVVLDLFFWALIGQCPIRPLTIDAFLCCRSTVLLYMVYAPALRADLVLFGLGACCWMVF